MAATRAHDQMALGQVRIPVLTNDIKQKQFQEVEDNFDYYQRAQWLRAAVLGATDGLVSVASLMMGVGAVRNDVKAMLLAGFAGLVAGACSMAIGEFVSVYAQYDIEMAQMKREKKTNITEEDKEDMEKQKLPNPVQAAFASALAFAVGGSVALLAAAFIKEHKVRLAMVAAVASLTLLLFGLIGAKLGRTCWVRSCARLLVGGWMGMAITFGMTKLIGSSGMQL